MAATEETRRQLFETVRDHLGEPAAEQLMAVTIPANTELATRQDLDLLRAEMHVDMAALRGEMAEVRGEMAAHRAATTKAISDLEQRVVELGAALAAHSAATTKAVSDLGRQMDRMRAELYRAVIPIIAAVVGVVAYLTR